MASSAYSEEVPISKVFIPVQGYDDNDSVTAVISGELRNPCYNLERVRVTVEPDYEGVRRFRFRQFAHIRRDGPCVSGDLIDDPVPYTNEVALGRLGTGNYEINFQKPSGEFFRREFGVEKARVESLDNFDYAVVSGIEMDANFGPQDEVVANVTGILTSTCTEVNEKLGAIVLHDVFVVLPVIKKTDGECERTEKTFRAKVSLGKPGPGSYMLHVRSRAGKAVSKVFDVLHVRR